MNTKNKNLLVVDFGKYNPQSYEIYKLIVQNIFKHRVIRNSAEKAQLVDEICARLPIIVLPGAKKDRIYYRTIVNVINQLLYLNPDEEGALAYRTRKVYNTKAKTDPTQAQTLTQYSFFFVGSDKR